MIIDLRSFEIRICQLVLLTMLSDEDKKPIMIYNFNTYIHNINNTVNLTVG